MKISFIYLFIFLLLFFFATEDTPEHCMGCFRNENLKYSIEKQNVHVHINNFNFVTYMHMYMYVFYC